VALGPRELLDEVLVDAAQHVARDVGVLAEADPRDGGDEPAQCLGAHRGARVDLREDALERRVLPLDEVERAVELDAQVGLGAQREQRVPARLARHPEDVLGAVLVAVLEDLLTLGVIVGEPLRVRVAGERLELSATRGVPVGDVLQEDQAQREVLVLRRLDAAAQRDGGVEEELLGGDVLVVLHAAESRRTSRTNLPIDRDRLSARSRSIVAKKAGMSSVAT